jgi:acyl-coenzyme A thioesterase PaaI-like protein
MAPMMIIGVSFCFSIHKHDISRRPIVQHSPLALQDQYAPLSICFGCGPKNSQGLRIKSVVDNERVIATFVPSSHHQAFPNVINGGIIATVLDCHCNWAACWFLMQHHQLTTPPCTVTAEMTIKLKKPTPMQALTLVAQCHNIDNKKATIHGQLMIDETIFDEFMGVFVMVPPEHPAYHRW